MDWMHGLIDLGLHLDKHLNDSAGWMGPWVYVVLFAILFAETGLVVTPFLPGDSLLFAVGALSATPGSPLELVFAGVLLSVAAIIGDAANYHIGKYLGPKVFSRDDSLLLRRDHLLKAQHFYEKHGGKTIIIARFIPIIRTFAPFVAGIGKMDYIRFASFNVIGAIAWVWGFLIAGYYFGSIPWIQKNFGVVTLMIIAISLVPVVIEFIKAKRSKSGFDVVEATTVGERTDV